MLQLAEDLQVDIGQMIDSDETKSMPSLGVNAQIQLRDGTDRSRFLAEIKEIFSHLAKKYGSAIDNNSNEGESYRLMLACYTASALENNNITNINEDKYNV